MKILHVVGGSEFGGASMVITEIARAAASRGDEVAVLTTNLRFQEHLRAVAPRVGIVDLDVARRRINPVRDLRDVLRLRRHLKRHPFDVVHTHTSKGGIIGRLAARLAGVGAIVHTAHGFAIHERSGRLATAAFAFVERRAARWAHLIVTVSEFHREWALRLRLCRADKVIAIPNGIGDPGVAPVSRSTADARAVLCVSRLEPGKGIEELVEAATRVASVTPVRFLVAGEGSWRAELQRRIEAAAAPVELLGFRSDVAELMRRAAVVVLPSHREGLPIVALEALAAGSAIVASAIGAHREALGFGEAGRLVAVGDASAMAVAITELLTDPAAAAALGGRARTRFEAEYRVEVMTRRYLTVYDRLVADAASR